MIVDYFIKTTKLKHYPKNPDGIAVLHGKEIYAISPIKRSEFGMTWDYLPNIGDEVLI
jgi:hypothetical protein